MECYDENTLVAYVERQLAEPVRQQVAAHLDRCDACLAVTCAVAQSATTVPVAGASGVDEVGAQIGRYELLELLGRGGMGTVFVARDPQLDRKVALKVVRSERFVEPQIRARLSREARAMAKVKHAGVVTVYDAGELPDGVFIAMELVEGETLASWLLARERTWREIVRMFVAVGRGLAAAHAAGIVHRDFKPANVLIDRAGRAAVGDFGIALVPMAPVDDAAPDAARDVAHELTRTGVLAGTPSYMSPEQFRTGAVDTRSDQYSFAVALFEALYRIHPFGGGSTDELRAAVLRGELRVPPRDHGVPAELRRVVERALRTEPGERFSDMAALLDRLEAAARPRRVGLALAGGLIAATAIAGGVYAWQRAPEPAAEPTSAHRPPVNASQRTAVMVAPFVNRTGDHRLDDTLDVVVGDVMSRSVYLDQASGAILYDLAHRIGTEPSQVEDVAQKLGAIDARPVASVRGAIDRDGSGLTIAATLRRPGALPMAFVEHARGPDDAVAAATRLGGALCNALGDPLATGVPDHVLSRSLDALHAYVAGQIRSANGDNEGSARALGDAAKLDPDFVEAHAELGVALSDLGNTVGAAAELERAMQHGDRMSERQRLQILGDYDAAIGKYAEAITAYQQLLAKWPGDVRTEINLTAAALDAQSWPLALELARRSAGHNPKMPVVRANLLLAELASGELDDAARDATAMLRDIPEPTSFGLVTAILIDELSDRRADVPPLVTRLAAADPELGLGATTDLAIYEGRLDDAERALAQQVARGPADNVRDEQLSLARLHLRRGDRKAALAEARAGSGSGDVRHEYLAAAAEIDAGDTQSANERIRKWSANAVPEWRLYGKLLEGDLARARGRPADALAAYNAASLIGPSWLVHDRLARAQAAAGDHAAAANEAAWCIAHRAEIAVFASPSLQLLPETYLLYARELAASHAPADQVAGAWKQLTAIAPDAQRDPITDEARRALAR
ncbi:MAG TPA: protein kinase [Kofleriaceae bacterium]|nr:protein kinase [Kofleriaceae bacterium]